MPKDGPSAGVTLTTALVSCLSGIPVRGDVAMTGEITPARQCAAHRRPAREEHGRIPRGMKTVLIPKDNVSDLYEVDDEVKKNISSCPCQPGAGAQRRAAQTQDRFRHATRAPGKKKPEACGRCGHPQTTEQPKPGAVC